jgi:hypothetical protein
MEPILNSKQPNDLDALAENRAGQNRMALRRHVVLHSTLVSLRTKPFYQYRSDRPLPAKKSSAASLRPTPARMSH